MTARIKTPEKKLGFNPYIFLASVGKGRDFEAFEAKQTIFGQGDATDGLFFIQKGKVRISVVSEGGKEATLGIIGNGDFFGEGGLAGQLLRMSSATAMTECDVLHIEKQAMMLAMSQEPKLSALFLKYLLKRNIRYQDDLVDQLFNSSEKRLARVLLLMAHFGEEGVSDMSIMRLSQETLAEMVGTTRSRVNFFMNRFRKLGYINYDAGNNLHIRSSLLNVVLKDDSVTAPTKATAATPRANRTLEPPVEHGERPDRDRAHRPPLSGLKPAKREKDEFQA